MRLGVASTADGQLSVQELATTRLPSDRSCISIQAVDSESSEVRRALEASATGRNSGLSRGVRPDCLHRLQSLQSVCRCTAARHCTARRLARQRSRSGQAFALQGVQLRRRQDHDRTTTGWAQNVPALSAPVRLTKRNALNAAVALYRGPAPRLDRIAYR